MAVGSQICEAAARDAFHVELDHSRSSIAALDALMEDGWGNGNVGSDDRLEEANDLTFVLAAYLGEVFVRDGTASWQSEKGASVLYFRNLKRVAWPFELIEQKLREPREISLVKETGNWLMPATTHTEDAYSNT